MKASEILNNALGAFMDNPNLSRDSEKHQELCQISDVFKTNFKFKNSWGGIETLV